MKYQIRKSIYSTTKLYHNIQQLIRKCPTSHLEVYQEMEHFVQ